LRNEAIRRSLQKRTQLVISGNEGGGAWRRIGSAEHQVGAKGEEKAFFAKPDLLEPGVCAMKPSGGVCKNEPNCLFGRSTAVC